jgi:hypothetical protein
MKAEIDTNLERLHDFADKINGLMGIRTTPRSDFKSVNELESEVAKLRAEKSVLMAENLRLKKWIALIK